MTNIKIKIHGEITSILFQWCTKNYKVQFIEFLKIIYLHANKMPIIDYDNMIKIYLEYFVIS
jgi:hypothetical protein